MALEIEYLGVDELTPYENNARKHAQADIDAIAASIQAFDFDDPIGIWGDKNIVVEGHGRLLAAKKLGMTKVPCIRLDHLSDEKRRAYALAHNRTAELSSWDELLVGVELEGIEEVDMSELGFDIDEWTQKTQQEVVEDDYDPEPPDEPTAKRGEIWKLGVHRLMCGDATSSDDVQMLMGGGQADLYLSDPPYNVDYTGKTKDALKIQNDKMSDDGFRTFLRDAFKAAKTAMKAGAAFYIWHSDSEGYNFRGACGDVGWKVRECLIWSKNSFVMGRQDYQWQHEPCLYGWNDGGAHAWYSDRSQTTILRFDRPSRSAEHPTMKPVALFDYLIKNSSKKGDIVLDTFGGSGTTIMACEQNGRAGYCMELDPRYVDVIIKRWETFTGEKAVLLNGEI